MMDHVINALQPYLDIELEDVHNEWTSGQYRKLSDCPSYEAAKVLVEAVRKLERYYYGEYKTRSVRDHMKGLW